MGRFAGRDLDDVTALAAFLAVRHPNLYPVEWIASEPAEQLVWGGPHTEPLPALPPIRSHFLDTIAQIATALHALHQRVVVHGDLARERLATVSDEGEWGARIVVLPGDQMRRLEHDARADVTGLAELASELLPKTSGETSLDHVITRWMFDRDVTTMDEVLADLESVGWRGRLDQAQPNEAMGPKQLLLLRPQHQMIQLDRRHASTWVRSWSQAGCELWKFQQSWYVSVDGRTPLVIGWEATQAPGRRLLRIGEVARVGDLAFMLVPAQQGEVRSDPFVPDVSIDRRATPHAKPRTLPGVARSSHERAAPLEESGPILRAGFWNSPPRVARIASWVERFGASHFDSGDAQVFLVARGEEHGIAKRLLPAAHANPALRARFEREIEVLGKLRHVSIPRLLDSGTDEHGLPYFVMTEAGEESVENRLARGAMTVTESVATIRDVLAALEQAHGKEIVHRDIKPSNVMLPTHAAGFATLLDFGVARVSSEGQSAITGAGAIVGTPEFMSPEQVEGRLVTPASDVYGAGCLLYAMLAGHPPHQRGSLGELMRAHVESEAPPLPASVPTDLAALVLRMLAKNPAERPTSAQARDALDAMVELPGGRSAPDPNAVEVEEGIWQWQSSTMMIDHTYFVGIDLGDRRDGPRLRLHTLQEHSRGPQRGFAVVTERAARNGFAVFEVRGPRPMQGHLPIGMAWSVYTAIEQALRDLRLRGQHFHALRREHVHFENGVFALAPLDDATLLRSDHDNCDRVLTSLFIDLTLAPGSPPPPEWPPALRRFCATRSTEDWQAALTALMRAGQQATMFASVTPYQHGGASHPLGGPPPMPPWSAPPPPDPAPAPDVYFDAGKTRRRFGNYEVVRPLGEGGMAQLFLVQHVDSIEMKAVAKVLREEYAHQPEIRPRFLDEARVVHTFKHPNIIRVFDIGTDDRGAPYMLMELLEGEPLSSRVERSPVPIVESIEIAHQIALGLAAAHEAGVVHRDLKPANIMVLSTAPVSVKIIDFGIARVPRSEARTQTGSVMGTPAYMPPEQWSSAAAVDQRSDIYALGVTLFEMLAGHPPLRGGDLAEVCFKAHNEIAPPVSSPFGPLPSPLVSLVARMLAKAPADRPQSCAEVAAALKALVPGPRQGPEAELTAAGFKDVRRDATTAEGIPRYRAYDDIGPVSLYFVPSDLLGRQAAQRIDALAYLARESLPLFVPITKELQLRSATVYVRRDPVPKPLSVGEQVDTGPALAITVVVHRALALLRARDRSFETFSLGEVRATFESPESFDVMLQPPQVIDRSVQMSKTMAGVEQGDLQYAAPERLLDSKLPMNSAYSAGVLAYSLLSGAPPFPADDSPYAFHHMKVAESPPSLQTRTNIPRAIASVVDSLIAREPRFRSRPPNEIEADLFAILDEYPEWAAAARKALETVPIVDGSAQVRETMTRNVTPTFAPGERIGMWTIESHLRFGGDAELYVVLDENAQRAILKLWYADGVDPFTDEWAKFRRSMLECSKRPGFAAIRELNHVVRGRPRAYAVFEEIIGQEWSGTIDAADLPTSTVLERAAKLLTTLADAHALLGVVGDVSASNVIVREDGTPILIDVMSPGHAREERAGYGTPGYLAPELLERGMPSKAADMFSAGVLIAELAVSRRLFPDRVPELAYPVGGFEPPIERALHDARQRHGGSFAALLTRMLAIDPKRRLDSARAAAEELREIAGRARVRETSRAITGSSTLQGLERRLPRPIAQAIRTWRLLESPRSKIDLGYGLAELITRYLASLAVADYLTGPLADNVETELQGILRTPSFGKWLSLARTTSRALAGRAFMPELVELFGTRSSGHEALNKLVELRNAKAHLAPHVPDGVVDQVVHELAKHLVTLLNSIRFLSTYPLLHTREQSVHGRQRYDGTYLDLHGSASEPEHRRLRSSEPVPSNRVIVASPDLQDRLILDPFVVHRECGACAAIHHTYVVVGIGEKDFDYVDLVSTHKHRERPRGADGQLTFSELLARREDLALRGPFSVAAADGERFWTGDSPVRPGQRLADVVLEEEIGRGATGLVYRGRDVALGRTCAVKIVRPEILGEDRKLLHNLQLEARRLARLEHPNVVRVFQSGTTPDDNNCFIVMELLDGGSLEDRLRTNEPLAFDQVLTLGEQLVEAVSYVHGAGIVHRDLKPANVLFAGPLQIKIVDFGMARDLRATASMSAGFGGATPMYCAPEQLSSKGNIGGWTDVYALGLMLYDLATGKPPTLDPYARAKAIRTAANQLKNGTAPRTLEHHRDAGLGSFLEVLVAMTETDLEKRIKITDVRLVTN